MFDDPFQAIVFVKEFIEVLYIPADCLSHEQTAYQ